MPARVLVCLLALVLGVLGGTTPAGAQAGTGSITGTVVSPDGEPLESVCVEAYADDASGGFAASATGSDGSYRLEGLPAGSYVVGFNTCGDEPLPGYAPQFYDGASTFDDATRVAVRQGETTSGINTDLEPTGSFSGTIVDDETGEPLEGICVVGFEGEVGAFGQALTDESGTYLVPDLPAGEYSVVFGDCADPYVHITEFYDDVQVTGQEPVGEPTPVVIVSGEDTGDVDAALAEGGAVEGVVTGLHTGEEQPLVCVGLFAADSQDESAPPVAVTITGVSPTPDAQAASPGDFILPGVPAGDYVLAFNPGICEDDGYQTGWYDGGVTRADADVITVTQGEVVEGIDAVVAPAPSISFACPFEVDGEPSRFSDVTEGNVHRQAIDCLALFEVVLGRPDGTYAPAGAVTRAQLASFVARTLEASGVELPADPADAFDDDNGSTHEGPINQLAAIGVVNGKGGRRYAPAETVNRAQMATFLVNAYEKATGNTLRASGDRFPDDEGNVHEASIDKAATAGITAGTGSGYAPNALVRRDAMASFLARLLDRVQRDLAFFLPPGEGVGTAPAEGVRSMSLTPARRAPAAPAGDPALGSLRRLAQEAAQR